MNSRLVQTAALLAFWLAYILTRPLGASFGDLFSQTSDHGGLGFGTTNTSFIFLAAIAALVAFLTLTHRDEDEPVDAVVDIDENGASTVVAALPDSAEE